MLLTLFTSPFRTCDLDTVPLGAQDAQIGPYNFVRKTASDFGWDWGPAFVPSGINGPINLVAYSLPYLTGANQGPRPLINVNQQPEIDELRGNAHKIRVVMQMQSQQKLPLQRGASSWLALCNSF
jgi:hypothetical protein